MGQVWDDKTGGKEKEDGEIKRVIWRMMRKYKVIIWTRISERVAVLDGPFCM